MVGCEMGSMFGMGWWMWFPGLLLVGALVAFCLSMRDAYELDDDRMDRLRSIVAETIARSGTFRVTVSTGLIHARRPEP